MSEKLKTTVTYTKTFNLGNYESLKLGISKEIHEGESRVDNVFHELAYQIDQMYEALR